MGSHLNAAAASMTTYSSTVAALSTFRGQRHLSYYAELNMSQLPASALMQGVLALLGFWFQ